MLDSCAASENEEARTDVSGHGRLQSGKARYTTRAVRHLARGEILFQRGDTRARLYRVLSGAVCHYVQWPDGRHEVVEFAFPGDIIGLGNLETHISTAQCMVPTAVEALGGEEADRALSLDAELSARLAAAADREFEYLRERAEAVRAGCAPSRRLASLLLAVAGEHGKSGGEAALVPGDVASGEMAVALGLSLDELTAALRELETRGLVAPEGTSLRLRDPAALAHFADGMAA